MFKQRLMNDRALISDVRSHRTLCLTTHECERRREHKMGYARSDWRSWHIDAVYSSMLWRFVQCVNGSFK